MRKDILFFDVPNPQIGCFVILYTNNATVVPVAKDIVFGTVHADRLRDRDALTEQITPNDIKHICIAGSEMFLASNELKVRFLPYPPNRFHADEMNPGLTQREVHSVKERRPPIHRKLSLSTAQGGLG